MTHEREADEETPAGRVIATPVGDLGVVAGARGIRGVRWGGDAGEASGRSDACAEAAAHLERAVRALEAYFRGEREPFDLPLDLRGSDFQRRVWRELQRIPFGETRSYGEVAHAIGRPQAARAVGAAIGRNPVAVLIPCHRVVGAGGALTGFAGGIEAKRALLRHEAAIVGTSAGADGQAAFWPLDAAKSPR